MKKTLFSPYRISPYLALALFALTTSACGKKEAPVARLEVKPTSIPLAFPELATIRLTWEPIAAVQAAPTVFVHLVDSKGEIERTFDHAYPVAFQPGTPTTYNVHLFQTALASPLSEGEHRLVIGLYVPGGERWAIETEGEEIKKKEYAVAKIVVPKVAANAPRIQFTKTWLPGEEGGDRQSVVRRWLTGQGALRIAPIPGPGSFWLSLRIPEGDNPGEKLVVDGNNPPSVVVTNVCNATETSVSGPGQHLVQVPIDAAPADGQCIVRLRPNFHLEVAGSPHRRTVALENAAWSPKTAEDGAAEPQN